MSVIIKGCHIENCGTGIKADGKVDLQVINTTLLNNGKDIDLMITDDSIVELEGIFAKGAKFESISIKQYCSKLNDIRSQVLGIEGLSEEEKKSLIEGLDKLSNTRESNIIVKILRNFKNEIMSTPGKVATALIVKYITEIFLK